MLTFDAQGHAALDQIQLDADVFDALELSVMIHGGVGRHRRVYDGVPCCIHGHADFLAQFSEVTKALWDAGVSTCRNDTAITRYNQNRGVDSGTKLTFPEWCEATNVVRR